MKKCPFCAEQILDEAVKCKHCGEYLTEEARDMAYGPLLVKAMEEGSFDRAQDRSFDNTSSYAKAMEGGQNYNAKKGRWYNSNMAIIIALLCFGPLALPMVWTNPRYNIIVKIIITVVIVIVTIWAFQLTMQMYQDVIDQINSLGL